MSGKDDVFIIAIGELSLAVTLPSSNKHSSNSKGFLANKVSGDIVNKGDAEESAKRRVSSAKLQTFVEGVETVAKVRQTHTHTHTNTHTQTHTHKHTHTNTHTHTRKNEINVTILTHPLSGRHQADAA